MQNAAYDKAANGPNDKNRSVRFRDDRVGQAKQESEEKTNCPARPRGQLDAGDNKTNGESACERGPEGRRLVRKGHRQHHCNRDCAENDTAKDARDNGLHINQLLAF